MRCTYCGSNQHTELNCPKTWGGSVNRLKMYCTYCGSIKHNVPACPKTFSGNADRTWHPEKVANDFVKD